MMRDLSFSTGKLTPEEMVRKALELHEPTWVDEEDSDSSPFVGLLRSYSVTPEGVIRAIVVEIMGADGGVLDRIVRSTSKGFRVRQGAYAAKNYALGQASIQQFINEPDENVMARARAEVDAALADERPEVTIHGLDQVPPEIREQVMSFIKKGRPSEGYLHKIGGDDDEVEPPPPRRTLKH